jgi:hypothetical protein
VRTTRPRLLAVLFLLGAAVGWSGAAILQAAGLGVSRTPWSAAGGLVFFSALLGSGAWYMYDRVHRKRRRVDSLTAVRLLALAKASAMVGSLVAGVYAGVAVRFVPDAGIPHFRDRIIRAALTAGAALLVMAAGLLLERACKVPRGPEDDDADATGDTDHS